MSKGVKELLPRGGGVFSFFQGSEVVAIEVERLEVPELGEGATELLPRGGGVFSFIQGSEVVFTEVERMNKLPRR